MEAGGILVAQLGDLFHWGIIYISQPRSQRNIEQEYKTQIVFKEFKMYLFVEKTQLQTQGRVYPVIIIKMLNQPS